MNEVEVAIIEIAFRPQGWTIITPPQSTRASDCQLSDHKKVSPVSHAKTDRRSVIVLWGADEEEEDDSAVDISLRTATTADIGKGFKFFFSICKT